MSITNIAIQKSAEQSMIELIEIFQSGSYRFMYESDIQALLFSKMRSAIPDSIFVKGTGKPLEKYEVSIVNTEYGSRVDVSCLDVELAKSKPDPLHRGKDIYIYQLPLWIGIEIKYLKLGDSFGFKECVADYNKLVKLNVPHKYVLGFIQNDRDADLFFSGYTANKVDALETLNGIIIVSPNRIWKIDIAAHSA